MLSTFTADTLKVPYCARCALLCPVELRSARRYIPHPNPLPQPRLRPAAAIPAQAALIAFAGMNMLLQLYYPATLTPLAAISAAGAAAATFALPASQLLGRQDWQRVWRDFRVRVSRCALQRCAVS